MVGAIFEIGREIFMDMIKFGRERLSKRSNMIKCIDDGKRWGSIVENVRIKLKILFPCV